VFESGKKMSEFGQAESWLSRANHKLEEAGVQLKQRYNYSESVSASQECIELSIKAIFSIVEINFTKEHEIKEDEFKNLFDKIPQDLKNIYNYPRIYLLSKFWSYFYITAKYGVEKLKIGSDKVFKEEEADLALKHVRECYNASRAFYDKKRWQDG
jgi:HEPN domain-containing protein